MRAIPTENMVNVIRSIHPYRFSSVLRRAPLIIVKFNISPRIINYEIKYLFILSYINDSLKPLLLMSSMLSSDSSNVDVELISYLAQSAIVLAVNAQASLSRVRRNNIAKEIYGYKKSVNTSGNNTTGNSSNSKSSSGSNGRSNNFNGSPKEQEVNLPVGGRLFYPKQVWKELGLPNFCQEVVNGLKVHLLPKFKPIPNPIPFSIPEGPKSDCITKEVQDLLLDDAIEQVLPNRYSKRVFYSNVFTVPKPGTTLHRYYMVKLDIKKAYLHVLVDPQYRNLFRFVWKGSHYRWKTMPFGLSTAPRIFTMLLRPVLRMLRDINVSVIAYLDDLLIVGSTKEECLSNLKKTMDLLVKLGFKLNLEKSVLEPTQPITFLGLLDKPEPSNVQLLNNQNECTPPRLESMEAMSGLPTTHSFAFYPGEDELIQFEEGFYNTDLPNLEISNLVSDDSSTSSSSSSSYVSSSTGNIPRSIDQTISRVNTNPNSTTLETGDYSTFQSHVMSIIRIQKSSTAELLMKSWEQVGVKNA
ncbi:hypothetical protein ACTFIW_003819 [Dictyostelium discoideum]